MSNHGDAMYTGANHPNPAGTAVLVTSHGSGDETILNPEPSGDPDQPLNWRTWRKSLNYGLLTSMTLAVFTALSIQPVFWNPMMEDLNVTYQDLANGQAIQLVGLASSCVVFIPLTKKYGRRSTYIISTALVAATSWWTAYLETKVELYVTSLLYGLAASTTDTSVEMSINELFFVHQRATANGIYAVAVMAGSFLTPMIAGVQAEAQGWRACYITLAGFMTAVTLVFIVAFEENKWVPSAEATSALNTTEILNHEAVSDAKDKIDLETAGASSRTISHELKLHRYKRSMRLFTPTDESLLKLALSPVYTCFMPHVVFGWLQLASGVCWLVVLSSVLTVVFAAPPYNFNPAQVGYMYTGPTVGTILAFFYGGPLTDWAIIKLARRNGGVFEAEMRLYPLIFPAIISTAGLIIFGATADRGMNYVYPSIGGAMFAFGLGAATDISLTTVLDAFPLLVSHTFVAITFFRCAISIIGPFTFTPWLDKMGVTNMFIVCGAVNLFVNSLGIPLVIWGKRIRILLMPTYDKLTKDMAIG